MKTAASGPVLRKHSHYAGAGSAKAGRHGRHASRGRHYPGVGRRGSKQFYASLGWRLDEDVAPTNGIRIVQFTPPGSGRSVMFGTGLTPSAPGSASGTLVVSDIVAAHGDVVSRGITASEMWHGAPVPPEARIAGPDPKRTSYGSFFAFNDPDGVDRPGGDDEAPRPILIRPRAAEGRRHELSRGDVNDL